MKDVSENKKFFMIAAYGIARFPSLKKEYVVSYLEEQGCDVHQEYERLMQDEDSGFAKLVNSIDNCGVEIKYSLF